MSLYNFEHRVPRFDDTGGAIPEIFAEAFVRIDDDGDDPPREAVPEPSPPAGHENRPPELPDAPAAPSLAPTALPVEEPPLASEGSGILGQEWSAAAVDFFFSYQILVNLCP